MKQRFFWNKMDKKPRDHDDVLATVEVSKDERIVVQGYYVNGAFYDATFNTELQDVVAWMVAPKPYEDDRTEEDNGKTNLRNHGSARKRNHGAVSLRDV